MGNNILKYLRSYLVNNVGYSYSCLEKALNNVEKSFKFSTGETIIINVDYGS